MSDHPIEKYKDLVDELTKVTLSFIELVEEQEKLLESQRERRSDPDRLDRLPSWSHKK